MYEYFFFIRIYDKSYISYNLENKALPQSTLNTRGQLQNLFTRRSQMGSKKRVGESGTILLQVGIKESEESTETYRDEEIWELYMMTEDCLQNFSSRQKT